MKNEAKVAALAARAYELGVQYEQQFRGCGQCLLAAVLDTLDLERNELFQAATPFAGGIGLAGDGSCGAYLGSMLLIGDRVGRSRADIADPTGIRFKTHALAGKFRDAFVAEFGSVTCGAVQTDLMGRSFDLRVPQDRAAFDAAGGHADKCPHVVGRSAQLLVRLLADEDLLP